MPRSGIFNPGSPGIDPGMRLATQIIAVAVAHFGDNPEGASTFWSPQPTDKELLHKGQIIQKLGGQFTFTIGYWHLTVLAVEGS